MGRNERLSSMRIKVCRRCKSTYEYDKRGNYEGKSPIRCTDCQVLRKKNKFIMWGRRNYISNIGRRGAGHNTRNQHKTKTP